MGRHKKQPTQEQLDFRNSILRGKVTPVKNALPVHDVLSDEDKIKQCFYYLNNCTLRVNDYIDGNSDKSRLLKTAEAIQYNAAKLEAILLKILVKPA